MSMLLMLDDVGAAAGMGSFMDMAKFLASTKKGNFKDLEDEIGKDNEKLSSTLVVNY